MTNCDLILVPVNPDVFADRGLNILLEGLIMILHPHPLPKVAAFMNRARLYRGNYTYETSFFWSLVEEACNNWRQKGLDIKPLNAFVPDRMDIKRSIQRGGRLPPELEQFIRSLWEEIKTFLEE
jgi:chromosome partitioning protein